MVSNMIKFLEKMAKKFKCWRQGHDVCVSRYNIEISVSVVRVADVYFCRRCLCVLDSNEKVNKDE